MTPTPSGLLRRLEFLETALTGQRRSDQPGRGRPARQGATRWTYLAITKRVGVNYPTTGNTFGLQFLDREFIPTEGTQAVTDHSRSATYQAIGRTIDGTYIAENTVVVVIPAPPAPGTSGMGRWHILPPAKQTGIPFYNDSGEPIPPYACMWEVAQRTIGGTIYCDVKKPSASFDRFWLVNGGTTIPAAGFAGDQAATGIGTWLFETTGPVAIDASAASRGPGSELGPKPGSWLLFPYRRGFTGLGVPYVAAGVSVMDCKQRSVDRVFGKLYSQLTASSPDQHAKFEIWERGSDGKPRVSGWDKLDGYGLMLQKNEVVKAGTWAWANWESDYWELDPACDVDNTDSAQASPSAFEDFTFTGQASSDSTDFISNIQTGVIK